jgi:hypothetical protein
MTTAFVLGNGTSRLAIDPNELKKIGSIYACNAIYRDFTPDYLIAVDYKMVVELVENKVYETTEIWSNYNTRYHKYDCINYFEQSKGWSSGPTALWLASTHYYEEIYILGFDYHGIENNTKVNNVYAGTKNYKKLSDPPTYFGNWLNQTEKTMQFFSNVKYYRVVNTGQYCPEWTATNIQDITYDTFKKQINYQNSLF